jgi:hypothetical protein
MLGCHLLRTKTACHGFQGLISCSICGACPARVTRNAISHSRLFIPPASSPVRGCVQDPGTELTTRQFQPYRGLGFQAFKTLPCSLDSPHRFWLFVSRTRTPWISCKTRPLNDEGVPTMLHSPRVSRVEPIPSNHMLSRGIRIPLWPSLLPCRKTDEPTHHRSKTRHSIYHG